jgi:tRNA pseudouridine55 synthase
MNQEHNSRLARVAVDGLLLLNKPAGLTSNQALQKVKRLLNAKKAGHTGSLDPGATGMLPLCFGEATKVCAFLLEADKTYRVAATLGEATDTGDADGKAIGSADVPSLDATAWQKIIASFIGDIQQIPPMYSALKQNGKRLYELARQGQIVAREARPVRIHGIELIESSGRRLVFRVQCSKGTYVRTLVEDIAKAAGTLAHTSSLHRETVGNFRAEDMLDLPGAERAAAADVDELRRCLIPADTALSEWPAVRLERADAERLCQGQRVRIDGAHQQGIGFARVYAANDRFLGVGRFDEDGWLAPKRIFR